jgi:hypothetical protein
MKRLVLSGMIACAGLIVAGCRGNQGSGGGGGNGGSGGGGGGGSGGGMGDMATAQKTYTKTTIAMMRTPASAHQDVELDGVISLGITPSTKSPKIFVQDAAGGDFSAIMARCETSSMTHPCTMATASTVAGIQDGRTVTIQGTYSKSKNGFEALYIDNIMDTGAGTMPAPATVTLADIGRSANNPKYWFQRITVDMGTVTLKGFDWSPAEFKYTAGTGGCPAEFGWGMVPSTSTDTVGSACSAANAQPATAVTGMPPADEVLIGTDFYKGFTYSTDCACAAKYKDTVVTAANTMSGKINGVLIGDVPYMQTTVYQYVAPKANADVTLQ